MYKMKNVDIAVEQFILNIKNKWHNTKQFRILTYSDKNNDDYTIKTYFNPLTANWSDEQTAFEGFVTIELREFIRL
jgi:hypothetical protein